jgi:WD40 repeat protein
LRVYDIRQGTTPIYSILAHGTIENPSKMNTTQFSNDGVRILSSGRDSKTRLWDMRTLPQETNIDNFKNLKNSILQEFTGILFFFLKKLK